jgi:hypothetical protein
LGWFQAIGKSVVGAESTAKRGGVSPKVALFFVGATSLLSAVRKGGLEGSGLAEALLNVGISERVGALRKSGAVLGVLLEVGFRSRDLADGARQSAVWDLLSADNSGEEGSGHDVLHFDLLIGSTKEQRLITSESFFFFF